MINTVYTVVLEVGFRHTAVMNCYFNDKIEDTVT